MNARALTAFLTLSLSLSLSTGCSKKKKPSDAPQREEKTFVLDEVPKLQHKLDLEYDGKVELIGYKINTKGPVKPNQKLKITLYWRPKEKLPGGYKLFTHLLDASGEHITSLAHRGALRQKGAPPSEWVPGKVYVDDQQVRIPANVKTDTVQLTAGLEKTKTDRLNVTRGAKDSQNRGIVATFPVAFSDGKSRSARLPSVSLEKLDAGTKIKIDGKLDEEAWKTAILLGPFVDVKTGEPNKKFPVNGKGRLLWSDEGLYLGVEVEDKNVVGGFPKDAKDPQLWTKDAVELIIDPGPEGDNRDYYEIQINPQNLVFDSRFDKYNEPKTEPNGPFGHQEWSSKLKSAVVVDGTLDKPEDEDKGYVVEALIPWKSFDKAKTTPPALGDVWRLNLYAMQENGGVAWSPVLGEGNFHKASRFGKVRFTAKGWTPAPGPSGSAAPGAVPAGASSGLGVGARREVAGELKVPTPAPRPTGSAP